MYPGGRTLVSISHDGERGSGSRLGIKLGEYHTVWEDSGDQHIWWAPERLLIKTPQVAGAAQTPHPMQQTQQHFSWGMKTDLAKHWTLQTPRATHRECVRGQEKGYRKHHNFTRDAVRKTQFKDYCNNTFKSNSPTWKLQTIDRQLSEVHFNSSSLPKSLC